MNKRLGFGVIGIGVAAVLVAAARVQLGGPQGAQEVHRSEWYIVNGPPNATQQDMADVNYKLTRGLSLPADWSKGETLGKVNARLTGLSDPATGDLHLVVSGMDNTDDMQSSEIYIGGQLISTANRANGQITDRSGFAILTQSAWVTPQLPITVTLKWYQDNGSVRIQEHNIH
jgi:hypothetical protein